MQRRLYLGATQMAPVSVLPERAMLSGASFNAAMLFHCCLIKLSGWRSTNAAITANTCATHPRHNQARHKCWRPKRYRLNQAGWRRRQSKQRWRCLNRTQPAPNAIPKEAIFLSFISGLRHISAGFLICLRDSDCRSKILGIIKHSI